MKMANYRVKTTEIFGSAALMHVGEEFHVVVFKVIVASRFARVHHPLSFIWYYQVVRSMDR